MNWESVTGLHPDRDRAKARIPKLKKRLEDSAAGYIRVSKFKSYDRMAFSIMIEEGIVEIFDSPLGRAYRLVRTDSR